MPPSLLDVADDRRTEPLSAQALLQQQRNSLLVFGNQNMFQTKDPNVKNMFGSLSLPSHTAALGVTM